jgi:hypothetical protein
MFTALGQGGLADLGGIGMREPRWRVIVGPQAVGPPIAEALQQVTDGAR